MAAGTKLSVTYTSADGDYTQSYNRVDSEAEVADIQAAVTSVITNGIIFTKVPTGVKSMKLVTTTETPVTPPSA